MIGLDGFKDLVQPEWSHEVCWTLHKVEGESLTQEQKVKKFYHLHSYFYLTLNLWGGKLHLIIGRQKKKKTQKFKTKPQVFLLSLCLAVWGYLGVAEVVVAYRKVLLLPLQCKPGFVCPLNFPFCYWVEEMERKEGNTKTSSTFPFVCPSQPARGFWGRERKPKWISREIWLYQPDLRRAGRGLPVPPSASGFVSTAQQLLHRLVPKISCTTARPARTLLFPQFSRGFQERGELQECCAGIPDSRENSPTQWAAFREVCSKRSGRVQFPMWSKVWFLI